MKQKNSWISAICYVILPLLLLFVATGCGGSSSSDGRQTLPGENPLGPGSSITPPGGDPTTPPGGNPPGGDPTTPPGGDPPAGDPTPEEHVALGWQSFQETNYTNAINHFKPVTEIINPSTPNEKTAKQEALSGLGWSYYMNKNSGGASAQNQLDMAIDKFTEAINMGSHSANAINEARLGAAYIYLLTNDFSRAANYLQSLNTENISQNEHLGNLDQSHIHALLAYTYYLRDETIKANEQLDIAISLSSTSSLVNSIRQIVRNQ
ncbi:MAG: hypothetical protein GX221_04405 [Candidatus Riflebacteria bacterium]|nr:hypothetical protein [Candidatus Riflebacteria bacterium]